MKLIILSGKAGSGKDTVASMLKSKLTGRTIIISYAYYLKMYAKNVVGWDGSESTKPRTFLQDVGDLVKEINHNFLINRVVEDIEVYKHYFDNIIICDARFKDEIEIIKEKYKGIVIRINGHYNNLSDVQRRHNTETSLDNYTDFDYIVFNNGTMKELEQKVNVVMEELKW